MIWFKDLDYSCADIEGYSLKCCNSKLKYPVERKPNHQFSSTKLMMDEKHRADE